ncbi:uncharacterized protein LOC117343171 [Pecten maximus]|uniref:uncharacterized protein LOC117343171 n=1 Tax=Pecten maximus TaxID=6579 RepID=UPI0014590EF5|nr:uncharacterized protein LOC117343171 [Pecten maximus]
MHRVEYATSGGTNLKERGPYNPTPAENYLSGTGKSHVYRGPGYYIPLNNSWIQYHEYRALPPKTKRDAVLFESEDAWVEYQRKRDTAPKPSGITLSGVPTQYTGVPVPNLLPFQMSAWNRRWDGPGYFLPSGEKWFHDHDSPAIPSESKLFYNEEDWIKYKHMLEKPSMSMLQKE